MTVHKCIFCALLIILSACSHEDKNMSKSVNIEAEVNEAFLAVKKGDLSLTAGLVRHEDAIVEYIAPLLIDGNEAVKIEVVALLDAVGSEAAAIALVDALSDQSEEVRDRSSRSLYKFLNNTTKQINFESKLVKGIELGNPGAAALLLLGYTTAGEELLKKHLPEERLVKLVQYGPVIPARLPAMIALSRLGNEQARLSLNTEIISGDINTLELLLQAIDSIDSPGLLHALANKTFADEREISDGVPAGAQPARRVADLAVDVFVNRLQLEISFELAPSRRYNSDDINSVRGLIRDAIPQ